MTSRKNLFTAFAAEKFAASFAGFYYGYSYSVRTEIA